MSSIRLILKDTVLENKIFGNRVLIAWLIMLVLFLGIVMRLVFLQVSDHELYSSLSENNRIKILPQLPTRGLIYDRNGVLLADNRISYSLEILPEKIKNIEVILKELSQIIAIEETDIARFKKQFRQTRSFRTIPLRYRLTEDEVARLAVQRHRFPSIEIKQTKAAIIPWAQPGFM